MPMPPIEERLKDHAIPFLAALLNCEEDAAKDKTISFRTFPEASPIEWKERTGSERKSERDLTSMKHLALSLAAEDLFDLNLEGAGVFASVNETDQKGAKKNHIKCIRAYWADLDDKLATKPLAIESLPLKPTIVVKTPGGHHLYWVLNTRIRLNKEKGFRHHELQLMGIQEALEPYGADPKVCEIARVMRVPGFAHMKRLPGRMVKLLSSDGPRYTKEEIAAAFPPGTERAHASCAAAGITKSDAGVPQSAKIKRATAYLMKCAPALSDGSGHDNLFYAAIHIGPGFDLDQETTFRLLAEHYNHRCTPPWSEAELRHKVEDAFQVEERRGWFLEAKLPNSTGSLDWDDVTSDTGEAAGASEDPTRPCFGGFTLSKAGLYFQPEPVQRGGEWIQPPPRKVSGPFEVLATVRDKSSNGWGLRIHWLDEDGVPHDEIVQKSATVGDPSELIRMFVDRGLTVFPDSVSRKKFIEYIARVRVEMRARSVDRPGWQGSAYVFPDKTIGVDGSGEDVFLADRREHKFGVAGSLEDWKSKIGLQAVGNSRLAFAISCPFASVMLSPLGMESGGINFYGSSSKGKTTCAQAAGSVMGGPKFYETWRATSNGLESIAAAHNDNFLVLDEQGQALPNEVGEIAYMLANETDKIRSTRGLETRARRHWKLLFLSTAEITLADKMREVGKTSKTGQDVRLVDVPANPDGLNQAFERWDGFESSKDLADHLKRAATHYYGTPIRAFIKSLNGFPDGLVVQIRHWVDEWTVKHVPRDADSQVKRVADRFAIVAAAGRLATLNGILPWEEHTADWAAATCFKAWLTHRGGIGTGEHQKGIQAVLEFIDLHGKSRFADKDGTGEKVISMAGFRTTSADGDDDDGVHNYLFTPAGWKDACEGHNPTEVAKAMANAGLLDASAKGGVFKAQKKVRVHGAPTWLYVVLGEGILAYRDNQVQGAGEVKALHKQGKSPTLAEATPMLSPVKPAASPAPPPVVATALAIPPRPVQAPPAVAAPKWEAVDADNERDEDARLKASIRSSIDRGR